MPTVRRWRDRIDNPAVRNARTLLRRLPGDPPDVIYLADSLVLHVAPEDTDRRTLDVMIADQLPQGTSLLTLAGGGFHPRLFRAYFDLFRFSDARPVVITPLSPRLAYDAWAEHPVYGHAVALRTVRNITAPSRFGPIKPVARPTDADIARHDLKAHPTLLGDLTVGDYRRVVKQGPHNSDEAQRHLYAYHHTHLLRADSQYLQAITDMCARARELGIPHVVYETPYPMERGVELLGPQFREVAEANLAMVRDAARAGNPDLVPAETGALFGTGDFLDPFDGSEHLNQFGRARMADILTEAVQAQLRARIA